MYVIAFILMLYTLPEVHSGTIVITNFSPERLIIAADSRVTDMDGRVINDLKCKIHVLDTSLLFVVGGKDYVQNVETRKVLVDADGLAIRLRRENPTANTEMLANLWGVEIMKSLWNLGTESRSALIGGLRDERVVTGIFAGVESDGSLSAFISAVDYEPIGEGIRLYKHIEPLEDGIVGFFHAQDLVEEFFHGTTKRAVDWNLRLKQKLKFMRVTDYAPYRLTAAVEAAIKWSPESETIGGPVDTIILHKGGKVEWLQKKQNCDCPQQPPAPN